jgi:hypothetical protein
MKTKVIFKILKGEVIALFPELAGDMNPYRTCQSYMHVGQHSAADVRLASLEAATPAQYYNLQRELESIGYDLWIVTRFSRKMLQARIAQCEVQIVAD